MIQVERLIYEYPGKRALNDVSFTVHPKTITALVGPNGAGKSTLLRCIAALDEPFSGEITVDGVNVADDPRSVHRKLGYLSDFSGLYDDLTVTQCLIHAARLHGLQWEAVKQRVQEIIGLLELGAYASVEAGTLSRGWRQRLGIGQAIIHNPSLLLLDEPASGLDPESRHTLSGLFRKLRKRGMTLIVSSHILAELEDYCTDMLVLREGKVVDLQSHKQEENRAHASIDITVIGNAAEYLALVQGLEGVVTAAHTSETLSLGFTGDAEAKHRLLKALIDNGAKVVSFTERSRRLEDVYMSIAQESRRS